MPCAAQQFNGWNRSGDTLMYKKGRFHISLEIEQAREFLIHCTTITYVITEHCSEPSYTEWVKENSGVLTEISRRPPVKRACQNYAMPTRQVIK